MKQFFGFVFFVFCLAALAVLSGCKSGLAVGYRTVLTVRRAGDLTAEALAGACQIKRDECKTKHAVKTPAYAACVARCLKALAVWRTVKRALNTSLRAAYGVLEVARARKQDKAPWVDALKPGGCQLSKAIRGWADVMPDDVKSILALLKIAEGLVCK